MVPTTHEAILQAQHARLQTLPATALRGEALPERAPANGLMILRDGDPGDPEVLLSPLLYLYDHRAEIEVVVQAGDPTERDAALDTLLASIGTVLAADRTLGGLCHWVEPEAPKAVDLPIEGVSDLIRP